MDAAIGALLMGMSLAAGLIRRLPMTSFAVYLVVGIGAGLWVFTCWTSISCATRRDLAYAVVHGLAGPQASLLAGVAITVITLSVVLHGFSAQPLLAWRDRAIDRTGASAE